MKPTWEIGELLHHHLGHNPRGVRKARVSLHFLAILTSGLWRPGKVLGFKKKVIFGIGTRQVCPSVVLRMGAYSPSTYSSPEHLRKAEAAEISGKPT